MASGTIRARLGEPDALRDASAAMLARSSESDQTADIADPFPSVAPPDIVEPVPGAGSGVAALVAEGTAFGELLCSAMLVSCAVLGLAAGGCGVSDAD